ncbi:MAG: hypothetical protein IPP51_09115 [Bacteroidetes bacterium]|nr:hypothetical protein [Bacteroidota bacterium]
MIVSNRSGDICAKLYLQNIRFGSKNVVPDKGLVVCAAVAAFLTVRPFHILVCGNVFAVNFPALAFDSKAISQDELLNVLHFLEENIKCDAIVLKDLPSIYTNEKMLPLGYQDYLADLTMSLDILPHWKSLEDYQNDLSKSIAKECNTFEMLRKLWSERNFRRKIFRV